MIFSPVANFGDQSLVSYLDHLKVIKLPMFVHTYIVKNWLLALSSRKLKLFFFLSIGDDNNFLEEVKVTDIKEDKSQNQTTTTEAIAAPKAPSLSPPSSSMLKVS